jgi:hypothetical protein
MINIDDTPSTQLQPNLGIEHHYNQSHFNKNSNDDYKHHISNLYDSNISTMSFATPFSHGPQVFSSSYQQDISSTRYNTPPHNPSQQQFQSHMHNIPNLFDTSIQSSPSAPASDPQTTEFNRQLSQLMLRQESLSAQFVNTDDTNKSQRIKTLLDEISTEISKLRNNIVELHKTTQSTSSTNNALNTTSTLSAPQGDRQRNTQIVNHLAAHYPLFVIAKLGYFG